MKTVIVGGVAGGMSAATRLRRLDESADIVVFERGPYVSFANCGLPYYVGGVIEDRGSLLLQTPESLANRFRLDVRIHHEVIRIDRDAKVVSVRNTVTGIETTERYDHLVLAAGATASARRGELPTHTLRTIDDVDAIVPLIEAAGADASAVVIGAGFIGLEAVENLVRRGVHVTLVQRSAQVLTPLDPELAALVLQHLQRNGVDVRLDATAERLEENVVVLSTGEHIRADFAIDASGVRPEVFLAVAAGITVGASGGIQVDASHRTNDPFIYAVGDGVEKVDAVDGTATLVTMAGLANRHGRAVADAIAGQDVAATPALGTAIVGVFGLTIAMVGWNERTLVASGRPHRVIHTHPSSHTGYYPGAEVMAMKLLVDGESDRILGAQIVGGEGVDKRIDVIATAMAGGLTASALSQLELAYAPQYGSAKDPVNQLGYVADNLATGATETVQWHELDAAVESGGLVVDVRTSAEFRAASIPGAINVPLDDLRARHGELPRVPLIVHCRVGQRGHTAARLLTQLGHRVRNLDGGYLTWSAATSIDAMKAREAPAA